MLTRVTGWSIKMMRHRYGLTLLAVLTASCAAGAASVLFMRAFEGALLHRLDFRSVGFWCWVTTPLLFLASVELVRRAAPAAAGSGIPQAVFAAEQLVVDNEARLQPLVSWRTMAVKVASVLLGLLAGASIGREGPTVQVALCMYILAMAPFRRWAGVSVDLRSMVVAGAAAGLGAAFNTPLAGVTFAVEELSSDTRTAIREYVLISIVAAGIAAKILYGEYAYFGVLREPPPLKLAVVVFVGLLGGLAGAFFSGAILRGQGFLARWSAGPRRWLVPVSCSLALLSLAAVFGPQTLGPGNEVAKELTRGGLHSSGPLFPLAKMAATLLSYWSGVAGGIFAPCLSIGSALGADVARLMSAPVESCALVGMAAFLSGTIQAPMTSFVIIFEMTGHHEMLLPVMLAALLAFMVARLVGARHLYKTLAQGYLGYLEPRADAKTGEVVR